MRNLAAPTRHNEGVDPYAVLGVQPGASREEVQAAYRAAAKRWHPDRAGSVEAQARMAQLNAAWELLRDGPPPLAAVAAPAGALRAGRG